MSHHHHIVVMREYRRICREALAARWKCPICGNIMAGNARFALARHGGA